jgi:phenylalanyl-tRNA synthetase beta chain
MPKIEMYEQALFSSIGRRLEMPEFEQLLEAAKAELDERDEAEGIVKIELNDTNRPDLWSTAGLGRALRVYLGGEPPSYDFFSRAGAEKDAGDRRILVEDSVKSVRPYIAGFTVSGKAVDESSLKDIIQSQEKLCWNFGQKRLAVAMGVYRTALMQFPVHYSAEDPDATRFTPLGLERELSMREILSEHPKGQDFGWIVADKPKFPLLRDEAGGVLSFPPVINSSRIGAVEVGDENLFVELTGTDLRTLLLACSIVACDMADNGFTVHPVRVEYGFDTEFGRSIVTPYYFQEDIVAPLDQISRILGEPADAEDAVSRLAKMAVPARAVSGGLEVSPPAYRNDFMHPVDVAEDIIIGRGLRSFVPVMPEDFTVGRLTDIERFSRDVKSIMVGLGFQEMIFPYLGSRKDYLERMRADASEILKVSNPMSENYEYVRNSALPSLLAAEAGSANAVYPHHVFEVGKVARPDKRENYGSKTLTVLSFLSADTRMDFNEVNAQVSAVFYYLNRDYELAELDDARFIPGRGARILYQGKPVGVFGETHPQVLENWSIEAPVTMCEITLEELL